MAAWADFVPDELDAVAGLHSCVETKFSMGIYHLANISIRELIRTPRVGCIISDIRQSGYSFLYKNSVRPTFC
jgi:hypothetical protein